MNFLTPQQLDALRLAAVEPIRYYKGGYYTTPIVGGVDQRQTCSKIPTISPATLKALMKQGLLAVESDQDIYACRWVITDVGRVFV